MHNQEHKEPIWYARSISAGLAGCAAEGATHPIETLKVRLQVRGEKFGHHPPSIPSAHSTPHLHTDTRVRLTHTIATIAKEEGNLAFYNGLTAALQKQIVFGAVRIGFYDSARNWCFSVFKQDEEQVNPLNLSLRILAASMVCCVGVVATQPMDVVKLRMQAMRAHLNGQKRYPGSLRAYPDIYKHEGIRGLWKGTTPNMARNSIVSSSELVTYDVFKTWVLKHGWMQDNVICHFTSAFAAGVVTTIIASPVDVIKTRIMNSGKGVYRGTLHCAQVMLHNEGLTAFYKGVLPFYVRVGSWNIVMFMCYEQLKRCSVLLGYTS